MDFSPLFTAFVEHPAAAVAALEALALAFTARELLRAQAAHLQTALMVAPVAQKLAEGVEALERVLARAKEQ